jgi:hypothetical protein
MRILTLLICSLVLVGVVSAQDAACPVCKCYYTYDCGSGGGSCGGYGNCTADGKLDGTCSGSELIAAKDPLNKKNLPLPKQDPAALYSAVDSYFQAFLKAVNKGGGVPDQKLVAAAQKTMPSKAGLDNVEYAVWVSLDAVMGWDFMYPNKLQRASGYVGNIREVHGVSTASGIVEAARKGLLEAVQSGDSTKVAAPLQEFWAKNPDFIPRHLGRCYPHGHSEVTDLKSTVACQIDTLQRVADSLIKASKTATSQKTSRGTATESSSLGLPGAPAAKCVLPGPNTGDLR